MRDFCLFLFSPFLALLFGLNSAVLQADTVDDVAETQANLVEVLKLQESRSNELRAWKELKELMQGQLELDRRTLEILERELETVEPQLTRLADESTGLKSSLEENAEVVEFWKEKLVLLQNRLGVIVDRFPASLKTELSTKLQDFRAPEKDDDSGKMRRMFDLFLEIISRANDFNKDIHVLSEMHALPDGQQGLFTVVYLGLSGGYYFSERSGLAGTIHWSGSGWLWEEDKSLLEDLVLLEAVLSGQEPPQFMSFPFVNSKEPLQ